MTKCVTAQGEEIPGPTCPCDPRAHDGYSLAFGFTAVPATILGTGK